MRLSNILFNRVLKKNSNFFILWLMEST